jgi:hypothetical protein
MDNNILLSINWNVEFEAAHRFVLLARSDYYKTSPTHIDFTHFSKIQGRPE